MERRATTPISGLGLHPSSAIDGAKWNAVRTLRLLEDIEGLGLRPPHRPPSPPSLSTPPIPAEDSPRGAPPLTLSNALATAGDRVVLRDQLTVGSLCAKTGCRVGDIHRFCDGKAVGNVVALKGPIALVDFGGGAIINIPVAALLPAPGTTHPNASTPQPQHPPQPAPHRESHVPSEELRSQQVRHLVRSLRLKGNEVRRKENELMASRHEVQALRKQLDRAGFAAWVHAPTEEGEDIVLAPVPVKLAQGTDIASSDDPPPERTLLGDRRRGERRPCPLAGDYTVVGAKGYFGVVESGGVLHIHNATVDMQLDVCIKIAQDGERASKKVQWSSSAPRAFSIRIYPGDVEPVVNLSSPWEKKFTTSFTCGPVKDQKYLRMERRDSAGAADSCRVALVEACRDQAVDYSNPYDMERVIEVCCKSGLSFIDPHFPPDTDSIVGKIGSAGGFEPPCSWAPPRVFNNGPVGPSLGPVTVYDVCEGYLGNTWLSSTLAFLAEHAEGIPQGYHINRILTPPLSDSVLHQEHAAGCYRVALCRNGWWRWYVVDDWLPLHHSSTRLPAFIRSNKGPGELWPSLIEKALAKVTGTYEDIAGGSPPNLLLDLTGDPCRVFDCKKPHLFEAIQQHLLRGHRVFLAIASPIGPKTREYIHSVGLAPGRIYSVLKVASGTTTSLCLIRNLWGDPSRHPVEWSKEAQIWKDEPELAKEHGVERMEETMAWIPMEDVEKIFYKGGALLQSPTWWDVRFQTGFHDTRPKHVFEFKVHADSQCHITAIQPSSSKEGQFAAIRVEVMELTDPVNNRWELLAESNEKYTRSRAVHTDEMWLRAGCIYAVLIHQWSQEPLSILRHRRDIILRFSFQQRHFAVLRIAELTRDMAERLRYDGYPGFEPGRGMPATLQAQSDAFDTTSDTIMPLSGAPEDITAPQPPPLIAVGGEAGSDSDSDGSESGSPRLTAPAGQVLDPTLTAKRLRMHIGTTLADMHPSDRDLLLGLADSLERGQNAVSNFFSPLYNTSSP